MGKLVTPSQFTSTEEERAKLHSAPLDIDELEVAQHLVQAAIMACESIEDMPSRNGLVALLSQIGLKIDASTHVFRQINADFLKGSTCDK